MKLVRNGVFETNSSSAHSLAYGTEYILRGSRWYQPTEEHDFSNPMYRLDAVPDHYGVKPDGELFMYDTFYSIEDIPC